MAADCSYFCSSKAFTTDCTPYCSPDGSAFLILPLVNGFYDGLRAVLLCGWQQITDSCTRQWLSLRFSCRISQRMAADSSYLCSSMAFTKVFAPYCSVDGSRLLILPLVKGFHDRLCAVLLSGWQRIAHSSALPLLRLVDGYFLPQVRIPFCSADGSHQGKKSASGCTGCVQTHQVLGTLLTHPGRAHTTPNSKRTGNVNSDAARHGTLHSDAICQGTMRPDAPRHSTVPSDAVCQGAVRPDAARHGICLRDGACQCISLLDTAVSGHFPSGRSRVRAFSFWMQPCQSIFLLDSAVSGQMASGRCVSWHHGHALCQDTEHRSKYSCRICKHAAGSRYSDSVQFYSFYLMYIYIC